MAKDRFAPKPLNDIMAGLSGRLSSYAGKSQALDKQQILLSEFLGANLGGKCRVSNYRDGTLMIEAVSAPIALRLNYLKMDMLTHFRSAGMAELGQIKITANPQVSQRLSANNALKTANATPANKLAMSEQTADYLKAIAQSAPPSLKEKLERLARHGRK
ncbi:DciA family protein [Pseudoalteromonas ostreae]|uniref:DciA family protein n=1 Tax=Pseudoalteromonas ostreae TaxID=2774154 RepID=UPI001B360CB3|nr:DciA family protein [Pseudoalteromonas ostreae]